MRALWNVLTIEGGKHPKKTVPPNRLLKAAKITCFRTPKPVHWTTRTNIMCRSLFNSLSNLEVTFVVNTLGIHFSFPLIEFPLVCLTFQFPTIHKVLISRMQWTSCSFDGYIYAFLFLWVSFVIKWATCSIPPFLGTWPQL